MWSCQQVGGGTRGSVVEPRALVETTSEIGERRERGGEEEEEEGEEGCQEQKETQIDREWAGDEVQQMRVGNQKASQKFV